MDTELKSFTEIEALNAKIASLESRNAVLHQLLYACSEGIFVADDTLKLTRINPAFTQITGYAESDLPSLSLADLYPDLVESHGTCQDDGSVDLRDFEGEMLSTRPDGLGRPVHLRLTKFCLPSGTSLHLGHLWDISEIRQKEALIEFNANHDSLTGLVNRNVLLSLLAEEIVRNPKADTKIGVVIVDLDNFKRINDEISYSTGDRILYEVSQRLVKTVRSADILGRTGGDEFAVILPGIKQAEDIVDFSRRVLNCLKVPFIIEGRTVHLAASIGISMYPDNGSDPLKLIGKADLALVESKTETKNTFSFYSDRNSPEPGDRRHLEEALRRALETESLGVHYQPIVDIASGLMVGSEALARWHDVELGDISPAQFIPLAEETGLIDELGAWVFKTACRQTGVWNRKGLAHGRVSINCSTLQFIQDGFVEKIESTIRNAGIVPEFIGIEITESCIVENVERSVDILGRLKALGIRISVDDFGTGYSSLAYLKRFPIDILKIDQSFVRDTDMHPSDRNIISAIIAMAHGMGIRVIAEGVETRDQLEFLKSEGCDYVQGFLFSRAIPSDDLARYIAAMT